MSASAMALIGLVIWSAVLTFVLLGARIAALRGGAKELNSFAPEGTDLGPAGRRITRAHANSLEYLACAAALLLYAIASGQTAVTDGLAMVLLGARIAQSVTHIVSTSKPAVLLRATLFGVQVLIWLCWAWRFVAAA
ncbi:MAG: MAPEG family protein [Gammaproteobacteria bacterium]|nr:MAPEG family protein [Gammaproteobacteria bacterium]